MRTAKILSTLLVTAGLLAGCESTKSRAAEPPRVDLPSSEQVQLKVQITARETAPPREG